MSHPNAESDNNDRSQREAFSDDALHTVLLLGNGLERGLGLFRRIGVV
jgi:hypothetical protein